MFKKILIGMAAFAVVCMLARTGYSVGRHLAEAERAATPTTDAAPT